MVGRQEIIDRYHYALLDKSVDGFFLSGWSSAESQERRFEAMVRSSQFLTGSVVDYGCGTGDLKNFLRKKTSEYMYLGLDQNRQMVECATARHGPFFRHIKLDDTNFESVDYIFGSGVFQFKDPINPNYYCSLLRSLFARCKKSLTVNFLSAARNESEKDSCELYLTPCEIFGIARSLSDFWVVDHSYHPGKGDVTLSLHKGREDKNWIRPKRT